MQGLHFLIANMVKKTVVLLVKLIDFSDATHIYQKLSHDCVCVCVEGGVPEEHPNL